MGRGISLEHCQRGMSKRDGQLFMEQEINLGKNISCWTARCMHQQMTTSSFICGRRKRKQRGPSNLDLVDCQGPECNFFFVVLVVFITGKNNMPDMRLVQQKRFFVKA